jgi:hypothetical protein
MARQSSDCVSPIAAFSRFAADLGKSALCFLPYPSGVISVWLGKGRLMEGLDVADL